MNALLVSIDSLRLDYVSRTNGRIATPAFDAHSRDFCFFAGLFSTSTATRPVHTSLFTGLYPFEHGVLGQATKVMRAGLPTLFDHLAGAGAEALAFSEVPDLFAGLSYADHMAPLAPAPVARALQGPGDKRLVFLHYWGAHTPYGAADGAALGETARLLRQGQRQQVQQRYARAVERLFERQLAPLLAALDLARWSVFIFSDHGESWTADDPYHGHSLRNSALRVPLYYHIPGTGNRPPARPVLSLIDLYPTLLRLLGVEAAYDGFGVDIFERCDPHPYKLAQIHPDPMPADLRLPEEEGALEPRWARGPQWALFDARVKFTYGEEEGRGRLEDLFSEEELPLDEETAAHFAAAFARMQRQSAHAGAAVEEADPAAAALLERRLRQLGYLE